MFLPLTELVFDLTRQEIEVQFNTLGAGIRKFANEANDFVQELLNVPINPNEGIGEKVVDLPKQRDLKAVHGEQQVAKQPAAAAPMNFFDEACMKMSKKGRPFLYTFIGSCPV